VFGSENFVGQIAFITTTTRTAQFLNSVFDTILWYGKNQSETKYRQLLIPLERQHIDTYYQYVENDNICIKLSQKQLSGFSAIPEGKRFKLQA
jgi:adenine-specific DNA-methyltransferase